MALQLGAWREALIEAGTSPEKAPGAAEELAGYDREFVQLRAEMREGFFRLESRLTTGIADVRGDIKLLKWMLGAAPAAVLRILIHTFVR